VRRIFGDKSRPRRWEEFLAKLEGLGFYHYVQPGDVASAKMDAESTGYLYHETQRAYHADAEDLAEGGFLSFLESIKPFLTRQGITDLTVTQDFTDEGYSVRVNGEEYIIYSGQELSDSDIWELSVQRGFAIVNDLLRQAGSEERLYALYGGNDTQAIFLTPDMYALILESPLTETSEKPYQPTTH
jgi:hypothetical protein